MSLPRATGHPDYSSAGTSKFIPEIWSGKLLVKFYEATVLSEITNTDYEGEIKGHGDKVIIRTIPSISIKDYVKGQKLTYETPESPAVELLIDKGKYWAFVVDRVDKVQSDIALLDKWAGDASEQLKIAIDKDVLGNIYDDVHAANKGATAGLKSASFNLGTTGAPVALTPTNILDTIVDCGTVLDEQTVPEDGRFMVLPPWAVGMLKKSDIKDASLTGDNTSVLRNGRVGMIDRFTIYTSNLLATTTDGAYTVYNIIFGHKLATTFANQITETETLKSAEVFGDLVRGLSVYGYKVLKPEALGWLYARKG